jgi:predicted nucleic acid-binding protein
MTIIVDANILFSALITPDGRIGEIIAHPSSFSKMMTCHFAIVELFKHQPKIIKYAKRSQEDSLNILHALVQHIEFYSEGLIDQKHMIEAERLTVGVDRFDMNYVALALQTGGWVWTGDKKLINHLRSMGFERVLNTTELYEKLDIG